MHAQVNGNRSGKRGATRVRNGSRVLPATWRSLALGLAVLGSAACAAAATADGARVSTALAPDGGGRIVVEATGVKAEAPLFFTARAEQALRAGAETVTGEARLALRIVQGRAEVLTLGLAGGGEVTEITGAGLLDWAVRQGVGTEAGKRFLDLRPAPAGKEDGPRSLDLVVRTRLAVPAVPGKVAPALLTAGAAVGFESRVSVTGDGSVELRLAQASGLMAVGDPARTLEFIGGGEARLELALTRRGGAAAEAELTGTSVAGRVDEASGTVGFHLGGQARVERAGARLRVLAGRAALTGATAGEGWVAELVKDGEGFAYELVFDRKGLVPVALDFAAALEDRGDWRRVEFRMPAGAVVPMTLSGLAEGVEFDAGATVVPFFAGASEGAARVWKGFLPADGAAELEWRNTRAEGEGALSFTSSEQTEVRVGAGLLRQSSQIAFRILQGKLGGVRLRVQGPGEIVGVDGANVTGWKVLPADETGARLLEVRLSRPFEGRGAASARGLAIQKAIYRGGPGQEADVTEHVASLVRGRELKLKVENEVLGTDPAPGLAKQLEVGYTLDGVAGTVFGNEGGRIEIGRPATGGQETAEPGAAGTITVRSQVALGSFPAPAEPWVLTGFLHPQAAQGSFQVRAEPLRLTPEGGVRHSGFVRVANSGAVRLEVADVQGMMQLAPEQFPGAAAEPGARQVFVYRFPAAEHAYRIVAGQILPEVGVSEVTTYELGESDRVIQADIELDVREAPLRDWSLEVPADYTVAAVQGAEVADHAVESEAREGRRTVKVIFSQAVEGRRLLRVRLEKNEPARAGEWVLPALVFPGAKSVRGHVGVVATPGYRLSPARSEGLAEVPLSYFPKQAAGLQQAWRLREAVWSAALKIEALGQSVQADVFHLYSLREGAVQASVLINYFVVGAPAGEWRIAVPAEAGNIDVTGQGVRRDWRREGGELVVTLHQPVLGAATVLVTFEEPMSARGGAIAPGEVRPLGVQSERGYVEVVSPLQVKHSVRKAEGGLLRLEPLELPAEFRLLTSSPALAVYQYTARPFALELGVEWYAPGETVDQVVDFARFSSQIARDGQVVTDARFFVKTRGRKALRLELPAGVKLWEARVDNAVVNARADGAHTLVPLPARLNPNESVEVALRLGQAAGDSAERVTLAAPKLSAPLVIGEWTLRGDPGRQLTPRGGDAEPVRPVLTETGFEWLGKRRVPVAGLLALIATAVAGLRARSARWLPPALLAGMAATGVAGVLAFDALANRRVNLAELTLAATVVPADGAVAVTVGNVAPWRAMLSGTGLLVLAAGLALAVAGCVRHRRGAGTGMELTGMLAAGLALAAGGLLAQRVGGVFFFAMLAAGGLFGLVAPGLLKAREAWRRSRAPAAPAAATTAMLALVVALAGGGGEAKAADLGEKAAESLVQRWEIRGGRLFAEVDLTVHGEPGESFAFLRAPAVLTEFAGDGLRVSKFAGEGGTVYYATPERAGRLTARAKFELPVADLAKGVELPTGPAAVRRVTVGLDQAGWEFSSPAAVQVSPVAEPGQGRSGATLVLGPSGAAVIRFSPQRRDLAAEATRFHVETASLYLPGPGVVNGRARVTVRPVQGRVAALELEVPEGFTVGEVAHGPVGAWRFDPVTRRLRVAVEPAQAQAFSFVVETQRGAAALPFDLSLRPLKVDGAAGEVGMLALAFGGDAQPEGVKAEGLSAVNLEDFDATLVPRGRDGQPLALVQQVYRHGEAGGLVTLRVAAVAPEVRVAGRQVFSLGDDRLVLAADLAVTILRVGLFKLSFELPAGLEVEALSGPALSHWTEAVEADGRRVVTLHLNGRTIGEQAFALALAGPAPAMSGQGVWAVPRVSVREATRQTGELQIVPEKGLRLRALERGNVSQLDPRAAGNAKPGALVFRLLQADWSLSVGIEALEPWVTVQALQEVTAREGQTLTRLALRYKVENAAVKQLRVRLPGLGAEQARTLRATGPAVSDFAPVPGETEVWEIRFQRGILGETDVTVEHQGAAERGTGIETVATPSYPGVRQVTQFVAVRAGGRLELEASEVPRGWQRTDWSAVPAVLQDRADRSVPALSYRVAEPEGPLAVTVRRHEVADALKLRVTGGLLSTVFSPSGPFLTAAELQVEVVEKGALRVRLPAGARLFNTFVNGESVTAVREGDAYLFHVAPATAEGREAKVRLVYAVPAAQAGRIELLGPGLSVPLENVAWRVVIPPGYELAGHRGGLRLREEYAAGSFGLEDYASQTASKREAEAKLASDLIVEANALIQQGRQEQAGEMFSRVAKAKVLDEATNEDARVQLRSLKTQQAVVGLNTRRQRLYLDNSGGSEARRNEQLEQAANANPFIQGGSSFNLQQVDELLMGNTVEENAALRGIAGRIVDQQLAAEPAPGAIDVTLPESGRVLTFTRSLQVDGAEPLALSLDLRRAGVGGAGARTFGLGVLVALAAIAAWAARGWRRA